MRTINRLSDLISLWQQRKLLLAQDLTESSYDVDEKEEDKDFSRNISSPPSLRRRSEDFNPTEERFSFGASSLLLSLCKRLLGQSEAPRQNSNLEFKIKNFNLQIANLNFKFQIRKHSPQSGTPPQIISEGPPTEN